MNDIVTKIQMLEQRLTVMQQEMNQVLGELVDTVNNMRKLQMQFAVYIDGRVRKLEGAGDGQGDSTGSGESPNGSESETINQDAGDTK